MANWRMDRRKWFGCALAAGLLWTADASARSLKMLRSMPAAEALMDGRNAQYSVHFDGLVDHRGSRLWITRDGQLVENLPVLVDAAPQVLFGSAPELVGGRYELHWAVKSAPDGEVTEGSIGFTVRP